jgi:hypothetical protein
MTIPDRLVAAAIAQGADSPAARLIVDILEASRTAMLAISELEAPLPEELTHGNLLESFPEVGALTDLLDRAWIVA